MADVSFSKDGGMQDGTGDGSYLDFIHKYTHIAGVSILPQKHHIEQI